MWKKKKNFGLASHALYARPAGKNLHTLTKDMRQAELWLITDSVYVSADSILYT